ncbi:MAG TPA: hypothetical protein VLJ17_13155 [Xanthobacteraceae bacterium]|nr:hypothetical protein [Xanthobacteraceae bacterium]
MFLLGVPLLMLPFAVYNIFVFLMPGFSWTNEIWHFRMISGGEWGLTPSDMIIAASVGILLIEMLKSARISARNVIDHLLSIVLFVGMLVEFMMVKRIASTTFFLLLVISFVDVVGGFVVRIRAVPHKITTNEAEHLHTA